MRGEICGVFLCVNRLRLTSVFDVDINIFLKWLNTCYTRNYNPEMEVIVKKAMIITLKSFFCLEITERFPLKCKWIEFTQSFIRLCVSSFQCLAGSCIKRNLYFNIPALLSRQRRLRWLESIVEWWETWNNNQGRRNGISNWSHEQKIFFPFTVSRKPTPFLQPIYLDYMKSIVDCQ